VRGPAAQDFPEALDHLQLGAITGPGIQLQLGLLREDGCERCPLVPRRFVEHDDHPWGLGNGIRPSNVAQVRRKGLLPGAPCGEAARCCRRWTCHQSGGQPPWHLGEGAEKGERRLAVQGANQGTVALHPQGRSPRGDEGEAGCILAQ
jgi:hypothetical protein